MKEKRREKIRERRGKGTSRGRRNEKNKKRKNRKEKKKREIKGRGG